jgi:hypothetical protein
MPVSVQRLTASVVLATLIGWNVPLARADDATPHYSLQACALAYESSQEHRQGGALLVARSELARCSQDHCPEFMRNDCAQWSSEIAAEQPTVLLAATRGGTSVSKVRVTVGDRVLAERLPSAAIELDPGSYDIRFEALDSPAVVQHAVILIGEKNRRMQVDFASTPELASEKRNPQSGTASIPPPAELAPRSKASQVLPWALLAIGSASVGAGLGFAAWGHGDENHLRKTCSPNCTDAELQPARTKYVLGDASFGIGLISLSVATYLLLARPPSKSSANLGLPVAIDIRPNGVFTTYGARF